MNWPHEIKLFLLLFSIPNFVSCLSFRFLSYRQEWNRKYVKCTTITLTNQTINGCIELAQNMEKFNLRFEAVSKNRLGKPWTLFNLTMDGCSLLADGKEIKAIFIVDSILRALKKHNPRMPQQCPLKKDVEYCYDNFSLGSGKNSRFIPHIRANVNLTILYKNIPTYKLIFEADMSNN